MLLITSLLRASMPFVASRTLPVHGVTRSCLTTGRTCSYASDMCDPSGHAAQPCTQWYKTHDPYS
jgi:hypothetical protein